MRIFKCQSCEQIVFFENTLCEKCGHALGYLPGRSVVSALEPADGQWRALAAPDTLFRSCANAEHQSCNWLIEASSPDPLCACCRHNRTIPDLGNPDNLASWQKIEMAKHRLFYSLLRLGLAAPNRVDDPENGLAFDFLAEMPTAPRVMTGHDNGLITIALAEADDATREKRRVDMHEPYRTLLGHFRHETGHYFWDRLVRDADGPEGAQLEACRELFGDDREDYGAALQRHYAEGPPADWPSRFVTAYASTHPWEDFAETWAHYLHIVDTLETARAFGLSTSPRIASDAMLDASVDFDPYRSHDISQIMESWLPLTVAFNSLNRAMGQPDLYPFVLSAPAIEKLGFVHRLIHGAAGR